MKITEPLTLLGGLSPQTFMQRHWQKKPLLVRAAVPHMRTLLSREGLFELASRDDVESRVVEQSAKSWRLRRGPFTPGSLPPASRKQWTLLVQGVDLHVDSAHELLSRFRFVPQARLDDLMISWASDGGGVGPHFDSYDVFLLQAQGTRRWRIGRQNDLSLRGDVPLKILSNFEPEEEHLLEPGDMLYLPPKWAHDGIAEGECQTYSIGFRVPQRGDIARELLQRMADDAVDAIGDRLYADPKQAATKTPGEIPAELLAFANEAVHKAVAQPQGLQRALGEYLTEPKPNVWFEGTRSRAALRGGVVLDRRTRMMYDARHVFINGESFLAGGADARLMRRLADEGALTAGEVASAGHDARGLLASWREAGWLHARR